MKTIGFTTCAVVVATLLGFAPAQALDARTDAALAEARQVASELTDHLRNLLGRELARGGFAGAVRVCSDVALRTTKQFSAQKGRYVRRVSLRNRNPDNAPDSYERRMLEQFARLRGDGKLAPEYSEILKEGEQETLRYFKPITVGSMCLTCHGSTEAMPPEVKEILAARYPRGLATGYAAGDLRGAISVKVPLLQRGAR
jgi:hypothetical protein